jgi:hypothetical protein
VNLSQLKVLKPKNTVVWFVICDRVWKVVEEEGKTDKKLCEFITKSIEVVLW